MNVEVAGAEYWAGLFVLFVAALEATVRGANAVNAGLKAFDFEPDDCAEDGGGLGGSET